jgi:endo-1,4-beta-mannosidase
MKLVRFGVNYVPSKNWWFSWTDWERERMEEDLQAIASLGMDHIRIHCLWPVFQPNMNVVSQSALERLAELLDLADQNGLDVEVAMLDGWLSGFAFYPAWLKAYSRDAKNNMFTDREVIEAEKLFFSETARKIGAHPRFMGFDLGNELGVLQLTNYPVTAEEADLWQTEMFDHCNEIAPGKLHVNGVDHLHWFHNLGFSRKGLAAAGSMTSVHAWIKFTGAMDLYDPLGTGCVHLAEYCIELAKAYHSDNNRQVWLQEFGASSLWMGEDKVPEFMERTISNAASCRNLWGVTWWCSHDLAPKWKGFDPLEYDLGLFTFKNEIKPAGRRIAELIKGYKANPTEIAARPVALVVSDDLFAQENRPAGWHIASKFMNLISEGVRPSIVLEDRISDKDYLKIRGIKELVRI